MATVMVMEWPGLSEQQYDQVMALLGLDAKPAAGAIFHVAGATRDGLRVVDIWESQQAFETFQRDRLAAAIQAVGIKGQPNVQFFPVHNMYAPKIEHLRKAGSSSLPSVKV